MEKKLLSLGMIFVMMMTLAGCGTAGNYDRDGKKSFASGEYDKAAESFAAAVKTNPNRADYYIDYGLALIALGKYEQAIEQFDLAYMDKDMLVIKENNKKALRGKGIAYYSLLQYEDAIEEFKQALKIDELSDLDMDILYYMAESLYTIGSYGKAIKAYTSVLSINNKAVIAYNKRAFCYKALGEYEKSLADYDKAISLAPKNYDLYFNKYYLLSDNQDETGALGVLQEAASIKAVTKEDEYNLAKIHYFQDNYEIALSELSVGYANGFSEASYYIGEIYRNQKDYSKAIYYYDIYIDSGMVTTPNVYNQIAYCMLKTDQYEDALQYLEQGLEYNDANTMRILTKNVIIAYEKLGRYEDAKLKIEEYLKSYPKDSQAIREAEFIDTRIVKLADTGIME